jgi:NADH:ubiquinone oxidoreductase subunit C
MNFHIDFLTLLNEADIFIKFEDISTSLELWQIDDNHWQHFAELAAENKFRWAAGWAEQSDEQFYVHACFEKSGEYILLRATINVSKSEIPSQATVYAAANRSERHTHDMFGIEFLHHPDPRCWTRHKAWGKHDYPLRNDFPVKGNPPEITPPDTSYHFIQSHGVGVYEIPVGPVHAGIIEPGHFRFQAVGELILNLEERLGYVHKGTEKIAEGRTSEGLAKLAGRVSGDTCVSHAWAACMAMEQAAGVEISKRAALIRGIFAERERIANHLGDIGAMCNDVAFTFAFMQMMRLKELLCRTNYELFGHRSLMDKIIAGGVAVDINDAASAFL